MVTRALLTHQATDGGLDHWKKHPATFNHDKQTQDKAVAAGAVSSAFKELCKKCTWKCTFALGSILNKQ